MPLQIGSSRQNNHTGTGLTIGEYRGHRVCILHGNTRGTDLCGVVGIHLARYGMLEQQHSFGLGHNHDQHLERKERQGAEQGHDPLNVAHGQEAGGATVIKAKQCQSRSRIKNRAHAQALAQHHHENKPIQLHSKLSEGVEEEDIDVEREKCFFNTDTCMQTKHRLTIRQCDLS
jgi:hypothetical protein